MTQPIHLRHYDVLVLGGGLAGALLASRLPKNLCVGLIEKEPQLGGCLATFTRQGFVCDAGAQGLVMNLQISRLFKAVGFLPVWKQFHHGLSMDNTLRIFGNLSPLQLFSELFPENKADICKLITTINSYRTAFRVMYNSTLSTVSFFEREQVAEWLTHRSWKLIFLLRRLCWPGSISEFFYNIHVIFLALTQPAQIIDILREASYNPVIDSCTNNPMIQGLFKRFLGYSNQRLLTASYFWEEMIAGSVYPVGGFASLFKQLHHQIHGDVILNTEIATVNQLPNNYYEITDTQGNIYTCHELVIAMDIQQFQRMASFYDQRVKRVPCERAVLGLWYGMRANNFEYPCHFWVVYDSQAPIAIRPEKFYMNSGFRLYCKEHEPGYITLHVQVLAPYEPFVGTAVDYAAYKQEILAYYHQKIAQVLQCNPEIIVPLDCASPVTYETYTGNFHGSSVGWKYSVPHADIEKYIHGLYRDHLHFAGHWATTGGVATVIQQACLLGEQLNAIFRK